MDATYQEPPRIVHITGDVHLHFHAPVTIYTSASLPEANAAPPQPSASHASTSTPGQKHPGQKQPGSQAVSADQQEPCSAASQQQVPVLPEAKSAVAPEPSSEAVLTTFNIQHGCSDEQQQQQQQETETETGTHLPCSANLVTLHQAPSVTTHASQVPAQAHGAPAHLSSLSELAPPSPASLCTAVLPVPGPPCGLTCLAISADGSRAIAGDAEGRLTVWELDGPASPRPATWQPYCFMLEGHYNAVQSVAISADGRRAVSGSRDTSVQAWDLIARTRLAVLRGHRAEVVAVAITPDGTHAASCTKEGGLRLWDLEAGQGVAKASLPFDWQSDCECHAADRGLAIARDGRGVVAVCTPPVGSSNVLVWAWDAGGKEGAANGGLRRVSELRVDEALLLQPEGVSGGGGAGGLLGLGQAVPPPPPAVQRATRTTLVSITPDGRRVLTDLESHRPAYTATLPRCTAVGGAKCTCGDEGGVSEEEVEVQVGAEDLYGVMRLWDSSSGAGDSDPGPGPGPSSVGGNGGGGGGGRCLATLARPGAWRQIESLAVSSDGCWAAATSLGDVQGRLELWDLRSSECVVSVPHGHEGNGHTLVALSADGSRAVTAGKDSRMCVWHLSQAVSAQEPAGTQPHASEP